MLLHYTTSTNSRSEKYIDIPCPHSKLIDVTQTTRSDEGRVAPPKMVTDYARLFAEQFSSALEDEEEETDDRPHSDSTLAEQEDIDHLRQVLRKEGKELATWRKPNNLGALSIQFDDLMSRPPPPSSKGKAIL